MTQFAPYKNIRIHFSDSGEGTVIVLLHGFLSNSNMWIPLIKVLEKNNRVIAIDLLGHGKTDCLGEVHSMEDMAEAVKAVLEFLNLERSIMIGHSMGGYVALAFAEIFSKDLLGLCLANSTALPDNIEKQRNRNRAIRVVKQNHSLFINVSIPNLFRPKNRKIFNREILQLKSEAFKMAIQGITAALEGMKIRQDRVQLFRTLPLKKLLIIGKKDPVLNYNSLIEQTKHSTIETVELPDGHMSYIENKKEFTYIIMHFIENL